MNTPESLRKHSVVLAGHRTSLSVEDRFWELLKTLAEEEALSVNALIERIDRDRAVRGASVNLSSAVRLYVVERLAERAGLNPPARSGRE